ncbi:hypothetical protein GCM10009801_02790 [Streptomyces albiaxialis]|uniref:Uncharacterized protein n=1 Tax=Streptomyces albiaxialis TaxID=329523 RepID=A0ABN2VF56_9ACTN
MTGGKRCARCGGATDEPVMIGAVEAGSGPGAIVYACPPCARSYAEKWYAPEWLRAELAARDAPGAPDTGTVEPRESPR